MHYNYNSFILKRKVRTANEYMKVDIKVEKRRLP